MNVLSIILTIITTIVLLCAFACLIVIDCARYSTLCEYLYKYIYHHDQWLLENLLIANKDRFEKTSVEYTDDNDKVVQAVDALVWRCDGYRYVLTFTAYAALWGGWHIVVEKVWDDGRYSILIPGLHSRRLMKAFGKRMTDLNFNGYVIEG